MNPEPRAHPVPDETTDEEWMRRTAGGDMNALHELYRRHGGRVLGFARRMLGDTHEAEEAVQDVFVRVWQRGGTYDARRASVWAWMAMLTRSVCLDRIRRRQRRPDLTGGEPRELAGQPAALAERHPASRLDVPDLLDLLRPAERTCVELMFLEGMSQSEVAHRAGLPLGTVKTHLRRGLLRLREILSIHGS